MAKAMEPLEQLKPLAVAELRTSAQAPCQLYSLVCELATFCVRQHSFRSRYYILSGQLAEKIVLLLKAPVKHLQLVALRFIRACVGLTDNFVNRFLLRRGLLVPIVDLFLQYKHRYNLINSACLELFDFITAKNQKPLIAYLIQNHGQMLSEGVTYSDAIQRLAAQHNRNKSMQATNASTGPTATNPTDDKVQAKRPRSQTADDGMAGRPGRGGMLFQTAQVSGSVLLKRHKLSRKPPTGGRSQFGSWSTDTVDDDESAYFESTDDDDPPLLPKAATAPASPMLSASPSEPSHPTLPLRRVASKDSGGLLADTTLTGAESEENESEADRRVDEDDNSCSEFLPMSRFSKATNDPDGRP
ncbi:Platinum sensitivity protein, partial [Dimargaris verticillata]